MYVLYVQYCMHPQEPGHKNEKETMTFQTRHVSLGKFEYGKGQVLVSPNWLKTKQRPTKHPSIVDCVRDPTYCIHIQEPTTAENLHTR